MHRPRLLSLVLTLFMTAIVLGGVVPDVSRTLLMLRRSMASQTCLLRSGIAGARHGLGLAIVIYKLSYPSTASPRQRPLE
jgi:hypothetical protein